MQGVDQQPGIRLRYPGQDGNCLLPVLHHDIGHRLKHDPQPLGACQFTKRCKVGLRPRDVGIVGDHQDTSGTEPLSQRQSGPVELTPVATGQYFHSDKEHLLFFVYSCRLPDGLQLWPRAEMSALSVPELLAIRENQVLRRALALWNCWPWALEPNLPHCKPSFGKVRGPREWTMSKNGQPAFLRLAPPPAPPFALKVLGKGA